MTTQLQLINILYYHISCCVVWRWLHLLIWLFTVDTITALLDFCVLCKLGRKESPRLTVSVLWHSKRRFRNGFDSRTSPAARALEVIVVHYDQCLVQIWCLVGGGGEASCPNVSLCFTYLPSFTPPPKIWELDFIYRVFEEEMSIFWEVIVSVILSKKKMYKCMCPIPNCSRDRAVTVPEFGFGAQSCPSLPPYCATVWSMWLGAKRQLDVVSGCTRRIARYRNVCYRQRKGTSRCTHTSNTPCPDTGRKVHWCWRRNFLKLVNCTNFVTWAINTDVWNNMQYLFINSFGNCTVKWLSWKSLRIGHMHMYTFLLRMTGTVTSQNIDIYSLDILYMRFFLCRLFKESSEIT